MCLDRCNACLSSSPPPSTDSAELADWLAAQPWADKSRRPFLSRTDDYTSALASALALWRAARDGTLSTDDALAARKLLAHPSGFELHIGMFIPTLLSQGDAEQQAEWVPPSLGLRIVGTYAQTELGHGTYVRGLETTATFDARTDSFILHTPTLSATKWWPGGLGVTATHAVVMARLFDGGGVDRGPHAFVVQLRDAETHVPLPGVRVGDIGPKLGFGSVDNGWLELDHVVIRELVGGGMGWRRERVAQQKKKGARCFQPCLLPHTARRHMLMKYASITPEGAYTPPPPSNAKASYATMVLVRATIVEEAGWVLARAATIATRYAAVRRQTAPAPGLPECQVLDYQNTAFDLLPLVATSYALIFQGAAAMAAYTAFDAARAEGDFSALPELHGLLAGMKAVSTWAASDGIEAARRCCGGHGYSALSGLPQLFASYVQNVTWEGDNNVMCLQTARFLVKGVLAGRTGGKPPASAAYVCEWEHANAGGRGAPPAATPGPDAASAVTLLRARAAALTVAATDALIAASGGGAPAFEGGPWNGATVDLIRAARAHCAAVLAATLADTVAAASSDGRLPPPAARVLATLARLHALGGLVDGAADCVDAGVAAPGFGRAARSALYACLSALRPDAVALVDAFAIPDYLLDSALGAADGDAYRRLKAAAALSPLSAAPEGAGWAPVLRDLLAPSVRNAKKGAPRARL